MYQGRKGSVTGAAEAGVTRNGKTSMNIPGHRDKEAESLCPGGHPHRSLFLDVDQQLPHGGRGVVEYAAIPVFPDHPWREKGDGGKSLADGLRQAAVRSLPPVEQRGFVTRGLAREPQP